LPVPDLDQAVQCGGGQARAVGAASQRANRLVMTLPADALAPAGQVPDMEGAVVLGEGEQPASGADSQAVHGRRDALLAGRGQPRGEIKRNVRGDQAAIAAEKGRTGDDLRGVVETVWRLCQLPETHPAVVVAGSDPVSPWAGHGCPDRPPFATGNG